MRQGKAVQVAVECSCLDSAFGFEFGTLGLSSDSSTYYLCDIEKVDKPL